MLTKPILFPINAFDATKTNTISFNVIGGDQVVANRLVVKDDQNNVVYDNTEANFEYTHTIASHSLTNLTSGNYKAVLYTKDINGNTSEASDEVTFLCYERVFVSTDLKTYHANIIRSSNYKFKFEFSYFNENVTYPILAYKITLYDSNKIQLKTTNIVYTNSTDIPYTCEWYVTGLENSMDYIIEVVCLSEGNRKTYNSYSFSCIFGDVPSTDKIYLENDCDNGYIRVISNMVNNVGDVYPSTKVEYIDDKYLDLTRYYEDEQLKSRYLRYHNIPINLDDGTTISGVIVCGEYISQLVIGTYYNDFLHLRRFHHSSPSDITDICECYLDLDITTNNLFEIYTSTYIVDPYERITNQTVRIPIKTEYLENISELLNDPTVKLYYQLKLDNNYKVVSFDYEFIIPPTVNNDFNHLNVKNMSFDELTVRDYSFEEFDRGEWIEND